MAKKQGKIMIRSKTERNLQEYLEDRVQFKINLYFKKARSYRFYHLSFAVIIAISAAIVPILINLNDSHEYFQKLATILSVLVTISVALQEIFRFREHWRNYNFIDTSLRREEMLFSMSSEPYASLKTPEEKQHLFVQRIEDLIEEERKETINMRTTTNAGYEIDKSTGANIK
jgi:hypothetical protein